MMIVGESVKVGQPVLLLYSRARGTVREIDHAYFAARVELELGGEPWCRLDELLIDEPWRTKQSIDFIGEEA